MALLFSFSGRFGRIRSPSFHASSSLQNASSPQSATPRTLIPGADAIQCRRHGSFLAVVTPAPLILRSSLCQYFFIGRRILSCRFTGSGPLLCLGPPLPASCVQLHPGSVPESELDSSQHSQAGWTTLEIEVSGADAHALSEVLIDLGALNASIRQAEDADPSDEVFVDVSGAMKNVWPIEGVRRKAHAVWADCSVVAMLAHDGLPVPTLISALQNILGLAAPPRYRLSLTPERDWLTETARAWYTPVAIAGSRLLVVPEWRDESELPHADVVVRLDPGSAFGDGQHATTRLCLEWLARNDVTGSRVLDFGCGTGVLSVAAIKLGAAEAVAVDIDPAAVAATNHNRASNNIPPSQLHTMTTASFFSSHPHPHQPPYTLVLANILIGPLRSLAPTLAVHCAPGGHVVLSGFVLHQREDIEQVYAPYFEMSEAYMESDWLCLVGRRNQNPVPEAALVTV